MIESYGLKFLFNSTLGRDATDLK